MAEDQKLFTSVSPHIRSKVTVPSIMASVLLALAPAALYALYLFGLTGALVMGVCIFGAMFTENIWRVGKAGHLKSMYRQIALLFAVIALMLALPAQYAVLQWVFVALLAFSVIHDISVRSKVNSRRATDWSAAVTGLLLAMTLPPRTPWWVCMIGAVVAISLGKQIFGGLGYNVFNPALVGRAFLVMSWPVFVTTTWFANLGIDAGTSATPLMLAKQGTIQSTASYYGALLWNNFGGCIGEVSAALLVIGGAFLIWKQVIDWRIPVSYLGTMLVMSVLLGVDPVFHLIAGGAMLGAFFMATDYVTTCSSAVGKIIFGVGCGFLTMVLRMYSGMPEGVTFAILFMNMASPMIDRLVRPKVFGVVKA